MTWNNGIDNTVWVCQLDPATGDLIPRDGRGTRIGVSAPFMGDWVTSGFLGFGERGTLNGPEWGISREGLGVYFTMEDDAGVYQQAKCLLSDLKVTQLTFGGTEDRHGNLASQDKNDEQARVGYYQTQGSNRQRVVVPAYWQNDSAGQPQNRIPLEVFSYNGPRWIPGRRALVTYLTASDNTTQVAEFNIDTEEKTFLTAGPENHYDGQIVLDPATSTQKYLICLENLAGLALYEWDGSQWVKQRTVSPPDVTLDGTSNSRVTGPRPFFLNGQFYFLYYTINGFNPTKIYLASADGSVNQPLVSGNQPLYQLDPEVMPGSQPNEVFVYFYSTLPIKPLFRFGNLFRVKLVAAPANP